MDEGNRFRKKTKLLIYAIQQAINSNPVKNQKISLLAREAGIDRKLLEWGFRKLFGVTIKKYQIRRKMEFSQKLLDEGRLTIKEISFKCGYKSQGGYAKAFKRLYGQSPTDWQNRPEAD